MSMFSQSEENYLKAIFHLTTAEKKGISTNSIAEKLATKPSSVTDMIRKLSDKKVVSYKKYYGVALTNLGRKIAANIVRKHRLWEVFLVKKLNFSWDEVHDVTEQLEHIQSKKLINELDAFLDHPTHDPHGDPIPDKDGNITKMDKIILSQLKVGERCICVGVNDSSADFLKYLDKHHIALGTQIQIISKEPFDESMTIKVKDASINISKIVSNNIYVKSQTL